MIETVAGADAKVCKCCLPWRDTSNTSLDWTGHHPLSAPPPQARCRPPRGSILRMRRLLSRCVLAFARCLCTPGARCGTCAFGGPFFCERGAYCPGVFLLSRGAFALPGLVAALALLVGLFFASAALVLSVSPCFAEVPLLSWGSSRPPVGGAAVTNGTSQGSFCPRYPPREFLASSNPITAPPKNSPAQLVAGLPRHPPQRLAKATLQGNRFRSNCPRHSPGHLAKAIRQGHPPRHPLPRQPPSNPARRPAWAPS